jgi:hypothetical protein
MSTLTKYMSALMNVSRAGERDWFRIRGGFFGVRRLDGALLSSGKSNATKSGVKPPHSKITRRQKPSLEFFVRFARGF